MKLTIVANSTPLIALARIGRLNILQEMFGAIHIPQAVYNEVATDSKKRSGSSEVEQYAWINKVDIARSDLLEFLMLTVDAGEAEAIALAREIKADLLLIDDKEGRRIADSVGQAIAGTIGLLLRYYKGRPEVFKKAFDELLEQGFRLKKEEYERIVAMAQ